MKIKKTKKRKLLILQVSANRMDLEKYNSQEAGLAKELVRWGYSTQLCLPGKRGVLREKKLKAAGGNEAFASFFPSVKLPGKQYLMFGVFKAIREFKPSVIQIHDDLQMMNVLCAVYARLRGIPVVLVNGIYGAHSGVIRRSVAGLWGFFLTRLVSGCVAKTLEAKKYLVERGYRDIQIGPVGLDVEKFKGAGRKGSWRRKLKIGKSEKVLLYVGQLQERRNTVFLIRLLKRLRERDENLHLILAGDGPDKSRVLAEAEVQGLGSHVHYVGMLRQTELPQLYREADLFLLPSDYEIFGMVMLEAGYFGLPVISTPTAGGKLIVREGVNGYIPEKMEIESWTLAVERVLTNADFRKKMSKAAKLNIHENFLWSITVKRFLAVYERAIFSAVNFGVRFPRR